MLAKDQEDQLAVRSGLGTLGLIFLVGLTVPALLTGPAAPFVVTAVWLIVWLPLRRRAHREQERREALWRASRTSVPSERRSTR